MSSFKAIFKKQFKDTLKNMGTLINFIIFPLVAFAMSMLVVVEFEGVPEDIAQMLSANMPNLVTMMAAVFAGMGLIPAVTGIISEDIEKKSLRFLHMAGVKPAGYLLGVGGITFMFSIGTAIAFGLISDFVGRDFWIFVASILSGVAASIVLGATIGITSQNQQSATALAMPIALILGFGPMMAQFNDTIARVLHIFYTQQLNVIADYLAVSGVETPLWQSFAIIWVNVAVLGIIFAIVYKKKGLKG
ncbi:MAG: ABC transporter permease [Oscillospiraceae bacterium]|nr:ABC transporter permease [Oscillospiraceae bacterium]